MLTLQLAQDLSRDPDLLGSNFTCIFGPNNGGSDSNVYIDETKEWVIKMYHSFSIGMIREYHKLHTKYSQRTHDAGILEFSRRMKTPYGSISGLIIDILSLDESQVTRHKVQGHYATFSIMPHVDGQHLTDLKKTSKGTTLENLYRIQDMVTERLTNIGAPIEGNLGQGLWKKNALSGNNVKFAVKDNIGICTVTDIGSSVRGAVQLERLKSNTSQ